MQQEALVPRLAATVPQPSFILVVSKDALEAGSQAGDRAEPVCRTGQRSGGVVLNQVDPHASQLCLWLFKHGGEDIGFLRHCILQFQAPSIVASCTDASMAFEGVLGGLTLPGQHSRAVYQNSW